jgi:hypothetical protein
VACIGVLALANCNSGKVVSPPDDGFQVNGFSVELIKTEPDDIAQILGINRWKFGLQRDSEQEVGLHAKLSITSPDQPAEVIDELRIFTTEMKVDGMVAIYPMGESLFNADEVRIYMQLGGGSTSRVIANPFKEFSSSYNANPADLLENQDLRLMAFSDTDPMPSPDNTVLILNIDTFSQE